MKKARVTISLLIFCVITFYFLDFANLLPVQVHVLMHLQLIPALIAVNSVAIITIIVLTVLFGRVYCSTVCPMGIFQDIINWISNKVHRKRKYPAFKDQRWLRWALVFITVLAFAGGVSVIVALLDPYSAYGRIASAFLKPVYLSGNNLVARIDNHFKNYQFYETDIFFMGAGSFLVAFATLLIVSFLSYNYGRLFCNTICPVGTVLGFLARFSLLKIRIDASKCNSCGLCAMKCKSSCIDAPGKTIDYSRCVTCFNCLEVCNRKAVNYRFAYVKKIQAPSVEIENPNSESKRKFLFAFFVMGVAGVQKVFGKKQDTLRHLQEIYSRHNRRYKRKRPITPPGSVNVWRFNDHCTACQLCVSKCPSNVLKPALFEYGILGMLQPVMSFEHGFCNYNCTACTEICPTNALEKITEKEKKTLQLGHVHYIKNNCIVITDGTDCGACSEHCPTQAVSMQPYKNGLRIPVINQDLCVGCGACEYICPTRPFRAIYVVGHPIHKQAQIPEEKLQEKIEVQDFGF